MTSFENPYEEIQKSFESLQLEYIDMILLHWPGLNQELADYFGYKFDKSKNKELRKKAWQALERLYDEKRVRSIGVSK
jgi:methylglyoxal/glyoxal reductase